MGLSGNGRFARPVGATGMPPWNGTVCWPELTVRPTVAARARASGTASGTRRGILTGEPPVGGTESIGLLHILAPGCTGGLTPGQTPGQTPPCVGHGIYGR